VLQVECRDTGTGIRPHQLEHIFEAFTQVGEVTSASDGAGIGLTIAREVARAMGGDVTVQSALGVGSAFTLTFALPAVGPKEVAPTLQLVTQSTRGGGQSAARRVLVVDDDDVGATIATAALERVGLSVERVRNGAEAVKHALRETFRPDIVLMDCRMPVMDGFDATREIRRQETALRLSRIPIIAVTASDSGALRDSCLAAGMDDLLPKPFATSDLYSMLMRWLDSLIEVGPNSQPRVVGW
jgi:CheY-like chemotaxis protein